MTLTTAVATEIRKFTPEGFDGPPTTVSEVLRQGRAVLAEEGRWMTGEWFRNEHPEVDPEDPFCNSWAVCAEGAVGIVACGTFRNPIHGQWETQPNAMQRGRYSYVTTTEGEEVYVEFVVPDEDVRLYNKANKTLIRAAGVLTGVYRDEVYRFNDSGYFATRTQVLAWFDVAIGLAAAQEAGVSLPYNLKVN